MNNEPVAWMHQNPDYAISKNWSQEYSIPLYTHPVKEQDTECQYCKQGCIRCDARKQLTDAEIAELSNKILRYQIYDNKESGVFEFARAILRKASEK